MTTEPPKKKPYDKPSITQAEWTANRLAIWAVKDEEADFLRLQIKKRMMLMLGKEWDPKWVNITLAKALVKAGYLTKPDWHERSALCLDHFSTDELVECYTKMKANSNPIEPVVDSDEDPF